MGDMARTFDNHGRSVSIHHALGGNVGRGFAVVQCAHGDKHCFVERRSCGETLDTQAVLMTVFAGKECYEFRSPDGVIVASARRQSSSHSTLDVAQGVDASEVLCVYMAAVKLS